MGFEIYFDDLTPEAQKDFMIFMHGDIENFDFMPLAVVYNGDEETEDELY